MKRLGLAPVKAFLAHLPQLLQGLTQAGRAPQALRRHQVGSAGSPRRSAGLLRVVPHQPVRVIKFSGECVHRVLPPRCKTFTGSIMEWKPSSQVTLSGASLLPA